MAFQSDAVAGASAEPPTVPEIDTAAPHATSETPNQQPDSFYTPVEGPGDGVHSLPESAQPAASASTSQPNTISQPPPPMTRAMSEALGPATEGSANPPSTTAAAGPTLNISLLLQNGNRHPYKIDEKYLRSRKVESRNAVTGAFDPKEISGYQLKELIWTDWRGEWEPRPASPSSIRLIHMGKLIEDKAALKDARFNMDGSNVVHMTVKPAELENDDETGGKGAGKSGVLRAREGEDRGAGCRCTIM